MNPVKPKNFDLEKLPEITNELNNLANGLVSLAKAMNVPLEDGKILQSRSKCVDYLVSCRDYINWLQWSSDNESVRSERDRYEQLNTSLERQLRALKDDLRELSKTGSVTGVSVDELLNQKQKRINDLEDRFEKVMLILDPNYYESDY